MNRDEYGRGPVIQAIDKAIATVSNKRIAEFGYSIFFVATMILFSRLDPPLWAYVLGTALIMFLSGAAYAVGTCDADKGGDDE